MNIKDVRIGICGLGLIGGSLAKAFKRKCGINSICALDNDNNAISLAISDEIIECGSNNDYSIFSSCDVVFVCMPINYTAQAVIKISEVSNAIISDAASTKQRIMDSLPNNIRFIGGHPMAGSERSGYAASSESLFENAVYILCVKNNSKQDIELIESLIKAIGAIPLIIPTEEHDIAVGLISHLPHIIASSLVNYVGEKDSDGKLGILAAGGFKDLTRIASSDAKLWEQILLSSGEQIINIVKQYKDGLEEIINILESSKGEELTQYLNRAKKYRDRIGSGRSGLLTSQTELLIEVSDRPGIIGEVTTLLGNNSINIKNLYIENNREYEGGCLRITLEQSSDSAKAINVLKNKGFTARAR